MLARTLAALLFVIGAFAFGPLAHAAVLDSQLDDSAQATEPPITDYYINAGAQVPILSYLAVGYTPSQAIDIRGVHFRVNTSGGGDYACPQGALIRYDGPLPPTNWSYGSTIGGIISVIGTTTPGANGDCYYQTTDQYDHDAPLSVSPNFYYVFFLAALDPQSSLSWVSMSGKAHASTTPVSNFGYRVATSDQYTWGTAGLDSVYFEFSDTAPDVPPPPSTTCTPSSTCVSNVMFLPGIEGSRLYEGTGCGNATEEKLWEPYDSLTGAFTGAGDSKVGELSLDSTGASTCSDIYTKEGDIIDTAGGNIYKSFIDEMNGLKSGGTMNDWEPVAYDWRLSLNDLLTNGAEKNGKIYYEQATSTPYILQTLRSLAATSKTGKVTIIAHSNGGLVAKALLAKLGDTAAANLVDKVVMVGVPQTGAPADIGATLLGYQAGIYTGYVVPVVSDIAARSLAQNSPIAYHLLPSEDYLESVAPDSTHPVISFSGAAYTKEEAAYSNKIGNIADLDNFLLAKEGGRTEPLASDLNDADILNPTLINYANTQHAALDYWTPPAGIDVDQIAGWGVDTVAGINFYSEPAGTVLGSLGPIRKYRPVMVEDGDGIVPVPSALEIASSTNVQRYWLNLFSYNKDTHSDNTHKDLFEVSALQNLIKNTLENSTSTLPAYVSTTQPPTLPNRQELTFFLHSPLTLQLTDSSGNVTGLATDGSITQNIPGSTYGQFGEVKYVTVPEGSVYHLTMHGLATGTFSLDTQETTGDVITASSTIADVPTTASTTVTMDVQSTITTPSPMTVDENGDGKVDFTITPKLGAVVTPDITPPELKIAFSTTTNALTFIGTDDSDSVTLTSTTTYPALKKNQKNYQGFATTTVSARDATGNTTQMIYTEQLPSPLLRDTITPIALVYNGVTTTIANSAVSYKWRINNGSYNLFASNLRNMSTTTESHWRPKKNKTIIMSKPQDLDDSDSDDAVDVRPTKLTLAGMVIPYITTQKGNLIIGY